MIQGVRLARDMASEALLGAETARKNPFPGRFSKQKLSGKGCRLLLTLISKLLDLERTEPSGAKALKER